MLAEEYVHRVFLWNPTVPGAGTPKWNIGVSYKFYEELVRELKPAFSGIMDFERWPVDYGDLEISIAIVNPKQQTKGMLRKLRKFIHEFSLRHGLVMEGLTYPVQWEIQPGILLGFIGKKI